MFSRFKRKQGPKGSEKYEFRFQFQASGVPLSGYDRLLVCVVPSGRSKSAVKTQKAPLRNGSVAWPGMTGVRMKLNRDKKGGSYEEAVYRFVLTSSTTRSGILGEGSLNMADCIEYVQKEKSLQLMNGSVATGTALHMTITSVRLSVRDGNDSSSQDEDAVSEDDLSQEHSESLTDPGDDGFGREIPLPRIKVAVQQSDDLRGSRFSQEPREANPLPVQPPRVVLQPTRPTGRDRMASYNAYALNGEARNSAPTLAPILIAQQPEAVHGRGIPSIGRTLSLSKAMERSGVGSFLPLAQTGPPSRSFDEADDPAKSGDYDSDRPSRSGGDYIDTARYDREDPAQRRLSYGGVPDPLAVVPPRGLRDSVPPVGAALKPSKVKELAAQIRERELESPVSSPQSPGDRPQPRFQVSTDRYVGRGLDRRDRPSVESESSESGGLENAPQRGGAGVDLRSFSASRLRSLRGEAEMVAELERMEVEIEGLRAQSESWQRSARNYAVENEQLRSEMKVQIQYTDEAGAEADEAARERDEARVELEKLRSMLSHTQDADDRQATAQWEVDDARRHVEELEEELLQHKEHIEGLQVQLDKLTESNQMLVEEVKDFEEQHDAKDAEVQSLKQQLEAGGPKAESSEIIAKVAAMEKENQILLARLERASADSDARGAGSDGGKTGLDARGADLDAPGAGFDNRVSVSDGSGNASDTRGAGSDGRGSVSAAGTGALLAAGTGAAIASKLSNSRDDPDTWPELEASGSSAELEELRTRVAELEAEASELASELAAAHKEVERRESRMLELERALQHAEGGETPRGDQEREEELLELQELVTTLEADLASAREGREKVTRQYDRLKQLLEEDNSEERIEELEKENQELQAQLSEGAAKPSDRPSTATSDRSPSANLELLAQVKLLETARETLTGQMATQAQEARSARLDLETRLGKAELEKTEADEKLRSLEAEVGVLRGSESAEKEQDAVAAFKGSLQAAADQSQQRLDVSLDRVRELEEEVNRQSFLVSKAEGAAFEAEERLKVAHLEFSEKSKEMVEKLAALQEELEQVADGRKGLEAKHVLTLRGLEMRHGEKEQDLQRKHLSEWGELHSEKQNLEMKHEEITGLVTGLKNRVGELEGRNAALEEELAGGKARLESEASGEKRVSEEKVAGLEAAMASITAQLNESLRVESVMAKEYERKEKDHEEKEKTLREEVDKLEQRVKELTEEVSEAVKAKDAVQKMWDDAEVSGKEGAEKIRGLQSQLDGAYAELKYKGEENEELNARIEELHSLVEDAQSQGEDFRQRVNELEAEQTAVKETIQRLTNETDTAKETIGRLTNELDAANVKGSALAEQLEAREAELAEVNERLEKALEERDRHELEAGKVREEVETHRNKGVELAALLAETQERLATHEETAGSLTRELESTAAVHTEQAAEKEALLKEGQQKAKKLETQVARLTAQIEEHVAAKEANHRRMSFAMQEGALAGAKVQGLEEELEELTKTSDELNKELERHVAEKEELKVQLAAGEEAKSEMEGLLKELRETHEGLAEVKGRLEEEHRDLKEKHGELGLERELAVKQYQEAAAVCEGLRNRVSEQDTLVGKLEEEISRLSTELKSQTAKCEETEERVKGLEMLVEEANQDKASVMDELTRSLTKIEQLEGSIRTVTAELETVRKEFEELHAVSESKLSAHKGAEGKVGELTSQLAVLTSQLHQHASSKQEVEARALDLHTEQSGLKERLAEADTAHQGAMERVTALTAQLTALQASSKRSAEAGVLLERKVEELEKEKGVMAVNLEKAQELETEVDGLRELLTKTKTDHEKVTAELRASFAAKEKQSQEADVAMGEKLKGSVGEKDKLVREREILGAEIEHLQMEVSRVQSDKQVAVERLENEMRTLHGQFQAGASDKEKAVSDALMSAAAVRAEKAELEERLRKFADDELALQGRVSELEKRVKELEGELRDADVTLKAAELGAGETVRKLRSEKEGQEKAWDGERTKLEGKLKDVASEAAALTAAKEAIEVRAGELAEQATALQESVEGLTKVKAVLEKQLSAQEENIEELKAELAKRGSESADLNRSSLSLQRSIDELSKAKEALSSELESMWNALEAETKARKECEIERDTAQSSLRETTAALSSSKEEAAKLEADRNDVETKFAAQHKRLSGLVEEKQTLEARVADVESEKAVLNEQVAEFERRIEGLTSQLAEAQSGLQEVTQEREGLQKELQSAGQSQKELEGAHGSKARALEAAAAASAAELAALQTAYRSLHAELDSKHADVSENEDELARHKAELEAGRVSAESVQREFAEQRKEFGVDMETVKGELAERSADVDRMAADVARVKGELAGVRAELTAALEARSTAERQLAESTARMKAEKETAVKELESEVLRLREGVTVAVAESTQDLRSQIEGLRKAVEDEKANGRRSAMQAANSASAETDELRDENFELKHRLIELETELNSGGGRRFTPDKAPDDGNALAEIRMKVTMLETELQNKTDQLAAAERRLQEAREEGIITPGNRPGLSRPASLARGIASPGTPELLVSPSGRSLLSPGTRRALAQSRNGRNETAGAPESPSSPAALEAKRADLQHRVQSLEGDLKRVIALLEKAKKEAGERERGLLLEVDRLQAANEQLAQGGFDLGMDQLRSELLRLQNQNAALTRSQRELQTQLGVQEVLEEEVLRLQEANDDLFQKISLYRQYGERAKTVERLHTLEVELQEAMEANMMYKEQLKAALSTHQNVTQAAFSSMGGDVDLILDELKQKKQQARRLESELHEMQNRYTSLSLKCAEVEANREEVVQELKRLKTAALIRQSSR